MSKVEHDPASSNLSIMEQIQLLIKPPPSEGVQVISTRPSNAKHPYYKRPGRGHNHDLCDACEEGGDLLCCDRCPSSFHLQCHDPPLSEEDIPSGSWMCHKCRMTLKITPTASKANSVERTPSLPSNINIAVAASAAAAATPQTDETATSNAVVNNAQIDAENIPVKGRNLRKRSLSRAGSICSELTNTQTSNYLSKLPASLKKALDPNKKPTPLDELIKAATVLNPKQFELPRELEVHMQFPGSDKVEPIRPATNGNKKANNIRRNSKPYELDSLGCVPLPAKTCFYCKKSCKRAPLIACDYCSLFYHQDCLDPPMTSMPNGVWICPNHAENFADEHMINSISVTERVRLWSKLATPVDREAVKMEFFRRVHNENPPFRIKVPVEKRSTISIPEWVKYHYENPPPLLPSLREALRFEMVKTRKQTQNEPATAAVDREKIADILRKDLEALRLAKAKYRELKKEYGMSASSSEDEEVTVCETEETATPTKQNKKSRKSLQSEEIIDLEAATEHIKNTIKTETEQITIKTENKPLLEVDAAEQAEAAVNAKIDEELRYLDVDLIKKLAYQRLQQMVEEHPEIVTQYQNRKGMSRLQQLIVIKDEPVPSRLMAPDDVRRLSILSTGDAASMLSKQTSDEPQLHPALATAAAIVAADEAEKKYEPRQYTDLEKAYEIATRLEPQFYKRQIRARAVLTPLGDLLQDERWFTPIKLECSFFMRYRQLHLGCSLDAASPMHVDLNIIGKCSRVSPKHATIFYDEYTKLFELINYSEYGTEVNGQLYTCSFKEPVPVPAKKLKQEDEDLQRRVEQILDRRRDIQRQHFVPDRTVKMASAEKPTCSCGNNPPAPMLKDVWDASAVLQHGSLIRCGCLSFVFSIPDITYVNEQG